MSFTGSQLFRLLQPLPLTTHSQSLDLCLAYVLRSAPSRIAYAKAAQDRQKQVAVRIRDLLPHMPGDSPDDQPLTAPAVIPLTICLLKKMNITKGGIVIKRMFINKRL